MRPRHEIGTCLVALLSLGMAVDAVCAGERKGPNIILIVADDLGYADIGCNGGKRAKTPHLDQLAKEGLRFTDFHSNGSMCSPTRAALLTGRYQQRAGIEEALAENSPGLRKQESTLAQHLRARGYRTAIIGKWHLGGRPASHPLQFGFETFRGCVHGGIDYQSHVTRSGKIDWWHDEKAVAEEGHATKLVTDHAVRFIQDHKAEPFFLYLPHLTIHFPWMTPTDQAHREVGKTYLDLSKVGPHQGKEIGDVVAAMIEDLDQSVGRIVAALRECKLDRDTMVFFTSDNGGYMHYPGVLGKISDNGPLRGGKASVYEGGHRVPAIAWWPGKIAPGTVTNATTMTMDLMPTFLDLTGAALPAADSPQALDGVSLQSLLLTAKAPAERILFWRNGPLKAVRSGSWSLVFMRDNPPELYDLANDLGQKRNLAAKEPKRVAALQAQLADWERTVTPAKGQ